MSCATIDIFCKINKYLETDTLMTAWKNEDYSPQTTPYGTPRPSPQSTPPPAQFADYW